MSQHRAPIPQPIVAEMPTLTERETWSDDELGARAQLIGLVHGPDRPAYIWRAPRHRWLRWLFRGPIVPEPQARYCVAPGCGRVYPCDAARWSARAYGLDTARM